jgi:hypothetical protein
MHAFPIQKFGSYRVDQYKILGHSKRKPTELNTYLKWFKQVIGSGFIVTCVREIQIIDIEQVFFLQNVQGD